MTNFRKTIAVDIDDVLAANAEGFARYSNRQWGHNIAAEDYQEDWAAVWGVDRELAKVRAQEFHERGVPGDYASIPDALDVLNKLKSDFDIVIVTSRRISLKAVTRKWIDENFPDIFADLHYVGIWDEVDREVDHKLSQTKAELCLEIGADYLVDDQLKHCLGAADAGIKSILFGYYKWNEYSKDLPQGVTRVSNWHEVEEYFYG